MDRTLSRQMSEKDREFIAHALDTAMHRFLEDKATFEAIAADAAPENPMVTRDGAKRLVEQFQRQADEAKAFRDMFRQVDFVSYGPRLVYEVNAPDGRYDMVDAENGDEMGSFATRTERRAFADRFGFDLKPMPRSMAG